MVNDTPVFNFDDFLEKDVEALPDRPKFQMPPDGKHIIHVITVNDKKDPERGTRFIEFKCRYVQCEEMVKPSDEPMKPGTEFTESFAVHSEGGAGALKDYIRPVSPKDTKLMEMLMAIPGRDYRIVTKQRPYTDKNSGEKKISFNTVGGLRFVEG